MEAKGILDFLQDQNSSVFKKDPIQRDLRYFLFLAIENWLFLDLNYEKINPKDCSSLDFYKNPLIQLYNHLILYYIGVGLIEIS
jgi:hypothetical protein